MPIRVNAKLSIPDYELSWAFSLSSGPGGQHVNTSDTKVRLSWDIASSTVLSAYQRERLLAYLPDGITTLTVTSSTQRSQWRNRQDAMEQLRLKVLEALRPPAAKRRVTKPTAGSKRRRLEAKSQRSATKSLRRKPGWD